MKMIVATLIISSPIKCQRCSHIETSQLVCTANQLAGFYMKSTLALNGLIIINENSFSQRS